MKNALLTVIQFNLSIALHGATRRSGARASPEAIGEERASEADLIDVVRAIGFHQAQVTDVLGLGELPELGEERMQVAAQFHAPLLVRSKDLANLIDNVGLPLQKRFDQFLRDLVLTDNSFHVSPDKNQIY